MNNSKTTRMKDQHLACKQTKSVYFLFLAFSLSQHELPQLVLFVNDCKVEHSINVLRLKVVTLNKSKEYHMLKKNFKNSQTLPLEGQLLKNNL